MPSGVAEIHFTAAAVRPKGCEPGPVLDVVLEAAEREFIPKRVRAADGLRPASRLLPPENNRPREYVWSVAAHAGEQVRIALIDEDDRPDCHVFCSGFRFVAADEVNGRAFAADMRRLDRERHMPPMTRLDSNHFLAIGDAADEDVERRLYNCETIYAIFFDHFGRKGFVVRPPAERMMLAVFDSQEGFEAVPRPEHAVGRHRPVRPREQPARGLRLRPQPRLSRGEKAAATISPAPSRRRWNGERFVGAFGREAREFRDDANIGTVMHEVGPPAVVQRRPAEP